jgi:hypothetical protein
MRSVQINYTDLTYEGKKIRLVRFVDEPQSNSGFYGEHDAPLEDPNANLAEAVRQEVTELFRADDLPLYFDSTALVFFNEDEAVRGFPSERVDDRDYQWHEATLKAQYA